MRMRRHLAGGERVVDFSALLALHEATAKMHRRRPLQIRKRKSPLAVAAVGGSKQREKSLVTADLQELAVALCPVFGREIKGNQFQFAGIWSRHEFLFFAASVLSGKNTV